MENRIIAFDGIDCIGKSYIINNLVTEFQSLEYIPYVFHLTGPSDIIPVFPNDHTLNNKLSIIQWTKFHQVFNDIQTILAASCRNIVILDRTPFSECIWSSFFNRNINSDDEYMLYMFLNKWTRLIHSMTYVNLEVDIPILVERIINKSNIDGENDLTNYLNMYNKTIATSGIVEDIPLNQKLSIAITTVKESFSKLMVLLKNNGVTIETFNNNNEEDKNTIISTLIK